MKPTLRSALGRIFLCLLALNVSWVCACALSQQRIRLPRPYQRLAQSTITVPQMSLWLEGTTEDHEFLPLGLPAGPYQSQFQSRVSAATWTPWCAPGCTTLAVRSTTRAPPSLT